jgi:hypothetical protein
MVSLSVRVSDRPFRTVLEGSFLWQPTVFGIQTLHADLPTPPEAAGERAWGG